MKHLSLIFLLINSVGFAQQHFQEDILVHEECELPGWCSDWDEALWSYVKNGQLSETQKALSCGANVNARNNERQTPLISAVKYASTDVIRLLLEHGADVNAINMYGATAINYAASNGRIEIVRLLLENGANPNLVKYDYTPLYYAASNGHIEIVRLLLENGANPNLDTGHTPLHNAASNGYIEIVRLLLEKDADIHIADRNGSTPLHNAASNGYIEIVRLLLEKGADVNTADNNGSTPLHYAARYGYIEIVRLLLEKGADVNTADNNGSTPLHYAARYGRIEIVRLLLENGANPNTTDRNGSTPLYYAASNGYIEIVRLLLENITSFASYSVSELQGILRDMVTQEYGSRAWTPIIEVFEARTGQRRANIATYNQPTAATYTKGLPTVDEIRSQMENKIVIGVVTSRALIFNGLMRVGDTLMQNDDNFLFFYAPEEIIEGIGITAFHGLIFPGSGDSFPDDKEWFTLEDLEEANLTSTEVLYQKVYSLASKHNIPTLGICAGAQHLVLHNKGALMKKKDYNNDIEIQPFNPIHYFMLTEAERKATLDNCDTHDLKINVMRAHSFAAETNRLGEGIELASIDGSTPLAFYKKFNNLAVQFHPENRYNQVSAYGDQESNQRQTQFLNSFFQLCKENKNFIDEALANGETRAEGIAKREAHYNAILERLNECKALRQ